MVLRGPGSWLLVTVCTVSWPLVTVTLTPGAGAPEGNVVTTPFRAPEDALNVIATPDSFCPAANDRDSVWDAKPVMLAVTVNVAGVGRSRSVKDPTVPSVSDTVADGGLAGGCGDRRATEWTGCGGDRPGDHAVALAERDDHAGATLPRADVDALRRGGVTGLGDGQVVDARRRDVVDRERSVRADRDDLTTAPPLSGGITTPGGMPDGNAEPVTPVLSPPAGTVSRNRVAPEMSSPTTVPAMDAGMPPRRTFRPACRWSLARVTRAGVSCRRGTGEPLLHEARAAEAELVLARREVADVHKCPAHQCRSSQRPGRCSRR